MSEPVVGTLLVVGVALLVAPIAVLLVAPPIAAERAAHRLWTRVRRALPRVDSSRGPRVEVRKSGGRA